MGRNRGVIMEGRDIGTVVFPDAELKIFLTASDEERARRRWKELTERGQNVTLEEVSAQQRERDKRDSSRSDSPLRPAPDAITIVSDGMTLDEVIQRILVFARARIEA